MALEFTLRNILREKKNQGKSNISPCRIIIFKKSIEKSQKNPSRYYNSITNCKYQDKVKYNLPKKLYKIKPIT
jgi:hypothetical protein